MDGIQYAITILTRAVTLDTAHKYTESLVCYQEGINILMAGLKEIKDADKSSKIRSKVEEYMERAEKLKKHIESLKNTGKFREQKQILEDSTGNSYHSIFARFLDHTVSAIEVEDPYIRSHHQCENFLRFVELAVKSCPNLKKVHLRTGKDPHPPTWLEQDRNLKLIQGSLAKSRQIRMVIEYSDSLHDREVRINNGWVIKIGRGLDFYKKVEKFELGRTDFDMRPCKETTIDIFHKKELIRP